MNSLLSSYNQYRLMTIHFAYTLHSVATQLYYFEANLSILFIAFINISVCISKR